MRKIEKGGQKGWSKRVVKKGRQKGWSKRVVKKQWMENTTIGEFCLFFNILFVIYLNLCWDKHYMISKRPGMRGTGTGPRYNTGQGHGEHE